MAVFFSGWAFLYLPVISRRFSYFAFALTAVYWVMGMFSKTHFLEWIMVVHDADLRGDSVVAHGPDRLAPMTAPEMRTGHARS